MSSRLSVIIPNYNGSSHIGVCLAALYSASDKPFEVVVVDDCSTDNSVEVISKYPCRLIKLESKGGASKARNTGAKSSGGDALFFIDSDCVVTDNTIKHASDAYEKNSKSVIGGSYTPRAFDDAFFSTFQSIFINFSELKKKLPDYIASHAMVIGRELFEKSGGFPEKFMPIIEDVEFSHRLKRTGIPLIMDRSILVSHIFNYTFIKSMKNAFRKSKYWTAYSLGNRDIAADSGTASIELKFNVLCFSLLWLFLLCFILSSDLFLLAAALAVYAANLFISRSLIRAFFSEKGAAFGLKATLYYSLVYPLAVAAGGVAGMSHYIRSVRR